VAFKSPFGVLLMHSASRCTGFSSLFAPLVCAVTLAALGCGAKQTKHQAMERYSQELRDAVSSKVPDERRKAQMLMIVDQLTALHRHFSEETASFLESYRKLNADYDATRSMFDQLFSDYSSKRNKARNEALDLHFQLASLATADEWEAIGKAETRLYEEVNAARPAAETR
jgi:hypothetical protein